jgi:hypothetical protein
MSTPAQIFTLLVSLSCLSSIVVMVRRGHLRSKYALIWLPTGVGMVVFAAVPSLLNTFALRLGISYPPSLLFMIAIALLIVVVVHLSWELSRMDARIQLLAETIALQRIEVGQSASGGTLLSQAVQPTVGVPTE